MLTRVRLMIVLCVLGSINVTLGASGATVDQSRDWSAIKAEKVTQGWVEVAPDVLERRLGDRVEHLGYGQQGLAVIAGELQQELARLEDAQKTNPSDEATRVIKELRDALAKVRYELLAMATAPASTPDAVACSLCLNVSADAYWSPRVGATASASFNAACGQIGTVYAYATAQGYVGPTFNYAASYDGPKSGPSVSSYASVAVDAFTPPCSSYAYAYTTLAGTSYSVTMSNSSCAPPPSCSATISGTTYEYFSLANCRSRTWTSAVSGGNGSYTYEWQVDGGVVGTGSSYSRSVCYYNDPGFTLTLTVRDSTGITCSDSRYVTVVDGSGGGCFAGGPGEAAIICP